MLVFYQEHCCTAVVTLLTQDASSVPTTGMYMSIQPSEKGDSQAYIPAVPGEICIYVRGFFFFFSVGHI